MATPFMGELKLMSFTFPPKGWALCNGQFLPINQNQALFSLLGTMYGGNGQTTFALPDLRGRVPVHVGQGWTQGQAAGAEFHAVTAAQMPAHQHTLLASATNADVTSPSGAVLAAANNGFAPVSTTTTLQPASIATVGGGQAHENRHPYLTLNWCIALLGIFPSRN
jgi:microcystin-dependent protein